MNRYFEKEFNILNFKSVLGPGSSIKRSLTIHSFNNSYKKTLFTKAFVLLFDPNFTILLQYSLSNK